MPIFIPPIKCQGIKSKIVPTISEAINGKKYNTWIEPFMGSGVVGFNIQPRKALFSDCNPHLIKFYNSLKNCEVTPGIVKSYLENEGEKLRLSNGEYYYDVRERFNKSGSSLDFLFLNRSCFNGVMRFNKKGGFNVPFCKKPERFAQALITKICNQIKYIQKIILDNEFTFTNEDFRTAIGKASANDFIYCDPPYIGRNVDYFDSWSETNEVALFELLSQTKSKFLLSTWESNEFRSNEYVHSLWGGFYIQKIEHFYHVGGSEDNRKPMIEALLANFEFDLNKKGKTVVQTDLLIAV